MFQELKYRSLEQYIQLCFSLPLLVLIEMTIYKCQHLITTICDLRLMRGSEKVKKSKWVRHRKEKNTHMWEVGFVSKLCATPEFGNKHWLLIRVTRTESNIMHATNLLGLDSGLAAVSAVIVTEGSVVDRVTVVVSHEWLYQSESASIKQTMTVPPLKWLVTVKR